MGIIVDIDVQLARRKMNVGDFVHAVGLSAANVSVLKNGRAKAIRFSTLEAICRVLERQPGDVLRWEPDNPGDLDSADVATRPAKPNRSHSPDPPWPAGATAQPTPSTPTPA